MDEKNGTGTPPTTPAQPTNPRIDPAGGIIYTARPDAFPIPVTIDDNIVVAVAIPRHTGGTLLEVNSKYLPVVIRLRDAVQTASGTTINVSGDKLPLTINITAGSVAPVEQEASQGTVLSISTANFPLQINLTP